ncbi:anaerobic ribonucleoside triphosphate reductase activating protein NrdG3 (plasmid) [Butyrivibrio proteoclasticus B316]|uniref:Anaerobic ribonucleoside-triphosphate reductase-activating protein n=1 Tax=Butyrivibrio proteoclasticus (strain ATCC 51982 / DSM 14932 / B316) TaxID=515622 RepID=E0S4M6_BUTPB|nr:anaerobic ribonucleoside-triphosphate reductase activating protein [Butyrivibrio proteoclasticus]ADL36358.1 anaerobic ribonucleoside triphosphate reductase activating protein NrdG3 [Butyrivibrio proteoclasticus B316]
MNYGQIYHNDVANGPGCRTSLFVSGCTHHCKGCFNEMTWDFNYGEKYTAKTEESIIESLEPEYIAGLTILGGEPMELCNQEYIVKLIKRVKELYPKKTIWLYSGYTWEELTDTENKRCHGAHTMEILGMIDILVDGEFVLEKKDMRLKYRGSSNQRIIDVKKTVKENEITLSEYNA